MQQIYGFTFHMQLVTNHNGDRLWQHVIASTSGRTMLRTSTNSSKIIINTISTKNIKSKYFPSLKIIQNEMMCNNAKYDYKTLPDQIIKGIYLNDAVKLINFER